MKYLLLEDVGEDVRSCSLIEDGKITESYDLEKITLGKLAYLFASSDKVISYGDIPKSVGIFRIDKRNYLKL